jgi:hypothetical protein
MGTRYKKRTAEFRASDSEGKIYIIIEFTDYEEVIYSGGKKEILKLLKSYQTSEGLPVNKIDEDNFNILDFDIKTGQDKIRVRKLET